MSYLWSAPGQKRLQDNCAVCDNPITEHEPHLQEHMCLKCYRWSAGFNDDNYKPPYHLFPSDVKFITEGESHDDRISILRQIHQAEQAFRTSYTISYSNGFYNVERGQIALSGRGPRRTTLVVADVPEAQIVSENSEIPLEEMHFVELGPHDPRLMMPSGSHMANLLTSGSPQQVIEEHPPKKARKYDL
jgi:hypothetical protein